MNMVILLNTLLCKIATMRTMLAVTIATSRNYNDAVEQTNEKCNTTTLTPSIVSVIPTPLKKKVKFARENQIYMIPTNDEIREYLPDMYWRFSDSTEDLSNNKNNVPRSLRSSGIYMDITMFHDIPILTTTQWKSLQMTKGGGSFHEIPEKGRMMDNCCCYSGGYSGGGGYEKIRTRIRI